MQNSFKGNSFFVPYVTVPVLTNLSLMQNDFFL